MSHVWAIRPMDRDSAASRDEPDNRVAGYGRATAGESGQKLANAHYLDALGNTGIGDGRRGYLWLVVGRVPAREPHGHGLWTDLSTTNARVEVLDSVEL